MRDLLFDNASIFGSYLEFTNLIDAAVNSLPSQFLGVGFIKLNEVNPCLVLNHTSLE